MLVMKSRPISSRSRVLMPASTLSSISLSVMPQISPMRRMPRRSLSLEIRMTSDVVRRSLVALFEFLSRIVEGAMECNRSHVQTKLTQAVVMVNRL